MERVIKQMDAHVPLDLLGTRAARAIRIILFTLPVCIVITQQLATATALATTQRHCAFAIRASIFLRIVPLVRPVIMLTLHVHIALIHRVTETVIVIPLTACVHAT